MSAFGSLAAVVNWRSWAVFRRNAMVFLRNWRTAVIPPAMEPVIFFVAFGVGFGGFIEDLNYRGTMKELPDITRPPLPPGVQDTELEQLLIETNASVACTSSGVTHEGQPALHWHSEMIAWQSFKASTNISKIFSA